MVTNATVVRFQSENYHEKLFERFKWQDFIDVILWAEGKRISAHRCVLAAGSKVFYEMLKACKSHNKIPVLVLNDIKYEHLASLVEYLYTGKTKINASEIDEFFLTVKRFNILGLNDFSPTGASSNTNNTSNESETCDVHCSMTYELPSDENDEGENDQTGQNGRGKKRKIDGNVNASSSQLDETLQNSASNMSKRACTLPQQAINGNDTLMAKQTPNNRPSTSVENPTCVAGSNELNGTDKQTTENGNASDNVNGQRESAQRADSSANTSKGNFKCPAIGCGRMFESEQKMVRHKKFKCAQSKVFKCQRCQQSFALNIILRRHTCGSANHSNANSTATRSKPKST